RRRGPGLVGRPRPARAGRQLPAVRHGRRRRPGRGPEAPRLRPGDDPRPRSGPGGPGPRRQTVEGVRNPAMIPLMERMAAVAKKPERTVVGVLSGTSADAIDVAVCRIRGGGVPRPGRPGAQAELLHYQEFDHQPSLRPRLRAVHQLTPRDVSELNVEL